MAKIEVKQIDNKIEWEDFLKKHEEANFLQSWYWGEFHKRLGKHVEWSGFYRDSKLVGVMLSIIEDAKRGRYLTVPGGPIIDWGEREVVEAAFAEMKRIALRTGSVFVRIRPQLVTSEPAKQIFKTYGCKSSLMHLHAELSSILDITRSEVELLAGVRKTTRHEIRKAQNIGIKIETSKDEKGIKDFYDLQIKTAKRQKFVPFSYSFFREQFKVFFEKDRAFLYTATFEGRLLAQAFIIFYGAEAVYHYGASTDEGRKYPGAYLLQWEAIKEAKQRGMKRYNFWGVAPEEERDHRFYGVSVFKRGFGGQDVSYLHAQDLVIDNFWYLINYVTETLRKKIRRV
ncbi:peptidoglycan bridge formation glycyltransferase FemA/FemB family protein [Patescibacteria group bacterium]|nr:peptidoglycan bridge formation glycyltransferase FemA/FemB family protein [Patescibacteria group bacterium]